MYAKLGYVGTQRHERHMVVLEAVVQSLVNVFRGNRSVVEVANQLRKLFTRMKFDSKLSMNR